MCYRIGNDVGCGLAKSPELLTISASMCQRSASGALPRGPAKVTDRELVCLAYNSANASNASVALRAA
jgi:hypothetical protein